MQPILFYTIGYPGAGKTSFAGHLAGWFGTEHVRADQIGLNLFPRPTFSPAERKATYQMMDYQSRELMNKGKIVLYDGTLNTVAERQHLAELAIQCGGQAIGLWMTVPTSTAKERAARLRDVGVGGGGGRVVPPEIFDRHVASFEQPTTGESYIEIDGLQPFGYQYRFLQHALAQHGINLARMIEL